MVLDEAVINTSTWISLAITVLSVMTVSKLARAVLEPLEKEAEDEDDLGPGKKGILAVTFISLLCTASSVYMSLDSYACRDESELTAIIAFDIVLLVTTSCMVLMNSRGGNIGDVAVLILFFAMETKCGHGCAITSEGLSCVALRFLGIFAFYTQLVEWKIPLAMYITAIGAFLLVIMPRDKLYAVDMSFALQLVADATVRILALNVTYPMLTDIVNKIRDDD
eukprot:Clim_evm8s136 gene=Clim_evmTU8s136